MRWKTLWREGLRRWKLNDVWTPDKNLSVLSQLFQKRSLQLPLVVIIIAVVVVAAVGVTSVGNLLCTRSCSWTEPRDIVSCPFVNRKWSPELPHLPQVSKLLSERSGIWILNRGGLDPLFLLLTTWLLGFTYNTQNATDPHI